MKRGFVVGLGPNCVCVKLSELFCEVRDRGGVAGVLEVALW